MKFIQTSLVGAYIIEIDPVSDERGFFARTWCEREFALRGLNNALKQCNVSFNPKQGTLRGMHFQTPPHQEAKLIRCTQGAIYDVIIDLRRDSPSFKHWTAIELSAANRRELYIPEGFAHGFQTLLENTEVFYQMSDFYAADAAAGVRWNDPAFGIEWPSVAERIISNRDNQFPDFIH